MATPQKPDHSQPEDSTIQQASKTFGEMLETGANIIGRGMAATVESMGQFAERAIETAAPKAERARVATVKTAEAIGRSVTPAARQAARTASRTAKRMARAVQAKRKPTKPARGKKRATKAAVKTSGTAKRRSAAGTAKRRSRTSRRSKGRTK